MLNSGKGPPPAQLKVGTETIMISKTIKIMGIKFDENLEWGHHMENLTKRSNIMLSGLKTIRHKLTEKQFMQIVTSQYYGVINYGIPVWYTPVLKDKHKQRLQVLHYKPLRIAIKDYERLYPREMLDLIGRAKPDAWAKYSTALLVSGIRGSGAPRRLANAIKANEYTTRRSERLQYYDGSKKRIGKQSIRNRVKDVLDDVDLTWWLPRPKQELKADLKRLLL